MVKNKQKRKSSIPITRDNCGKTKTCVAEDICKKDDYQSHRPCLVNPSEVHPANAIKEVHKRTAGEWNHVASEALEELKRPRRISPTVLHHVITVAEFSTIVVREQARKRAKKMTDTRKEQADSRHQEWLRLAHERLIEDRKRKYSGIKTFGGLASVVFAQSQVLVVRQGIEIPSTERAIRDYLRTVPEIRRVIKK